MADPIVQLPARFEGRDLSRIAAEVVAQAGGTFPSELTFDFDKLVFIRPAGVVFLSNLIDWLSEKGTTISLINCDLNRESIKYLDDSLFFERHRGAKLGVNSSPRDTTRPLLKLAQRDSHGWLESDFVPWLASRLALTQPSLYALKVSVSELFNNIQDHTRHDIGSIFVQHFPREKRITISVSDFGLGIPAKVREQVPGITDGDAIVKAMQDGFTTKSKPTNRGAGLDYLLTVVVHKNEGMVTVYSGGSIVKFERRGDVIHPTMLNGVGFSPGTTIDIDIPTDAIEKLPEDREELQW
jgi:anti-sigma regulatory factor (Ser/Thr protein kinase)